MRLHRRSLGISVSATAGPTMPSNVGAANNVITSQPYWNELVGLTQNPLGSASGNNLIPVSEIVSSILSSAGSNASAIVPQLTALYSFLPTYLVSASIVDAWDQQNNFNTGISYTSIGQNAQQALEQALPKLGVTLPVINTGGASSSSGISAGIIVAIAAGLLLLWGLSK